MAPPPPSQRGKFRPKKPQKKITKPAAAADATGAAASSSSSAPSVAFANPDVGASHRNNAEIVESVRGTGRGRGGRGRGGRGGRGRGRMPTPQGRVFFTGGEKKAAASAKGSTSKRTSISAGASRNRGDSKKRGDGAGKDGRDTMDTSTEEVVGQLDTAIGGSGNKKKESILERDYGDYDDDEGPPGAAGGSMNLNISAGCMYDSDSSDERSTGKSKNMSMIAPLELPFLAKSLSTGVGSLHRPDSYDVPHSSKPDVINSSNIDGNSSIYHSESAQPASPFVALHKTEDILEEKNSWFLVQLPTRLPPLQKNFSSNENDAGDAGGEGEFADGNGMTDSTPSSSDTNNVMNNISEVAVPPVTTNNFDHGLDTIAPGRIGKILVYKSGKTVLVMDSPDAKKVSMDVNEGLTCTFHQQAVAVNVEEGSYITLGDVNKSIVMSPDLTSI